MIERLLVVCTGNICRSPLAEALLRRHLPAIHISSAGIGALVGHPVDPNAAIIAGEEGLDVSGHFARQLDETITGAADLILVMEPGQARWIGERFPHAHGRVFLLGHWSERCAVPDPYRQSLAHFRRVYRQMHGLSQDWIQRLGDPISQQPSVEQQA